MVEACYRAFLVDGLGATSIAHRGQDFYAHLEGTHDLLQSWGNPEPICLAGLFHSIYGTWHFRRRTFPIAQRAMIRDLIGEEAEFLVYVFCVAERPKELLEAASGSELLVTDHHAKDVIALTRAELVGLLEIEAANLLNQGGSIDPVLARLAATDVSAAARRAI